VKANGPGERRRPETAKAIRAGGNVKTGWGAERQPDLQEGKALQGPKPHERYRHETRLERSG
jgi:hypothetical protein